MNQQQGSQESSSQFEEGNEQSTLSSLWLLHDKGRTHEGPKSEHPSTYDESIPPLSYRAQNYTAASSPSSSKAGVSPEATHKTSPEAEVPRTVQHPYSQYTGGRQVPSWAKPQQNNFKNISPLIWFIIGIVLLPPLLYIIINVLIPLLFLFVLFVLVLLFLLLALGIIAALWFIGRGGSMKPPFWW